MRAGRLKHRITIEEPSEAQSSTGAVTYTWATFTSRWARQEPLAGREKQESSEAFFGEADYRFTLRYTAGITKAMRVAWDSRLFDITAINQILDPVSGDRMTVLLATEDD
jgi:SPP1 family predicted phage head-tail adaptor